MLNIKMNNDDGVLNVALEGRLNTVTSKEFAQQIEPALKDARSVVLDFAKLDYISSAGLRVLITIAQHLEETGGEGIHVRNANGIVLETLEITGLTFIVDVE